MVREGVRTDSLKGRRGRLPSKPKSPQIASAVGSLQVNDAFANMMVANHHHQQQQTASFGAQQQQQSPARVINLQPHHQNQQLQHNQYHQVQHNHHQHPNHHHLHHQQTNSSPTKLPTAAITAAADLPEASASTTESTTAPNSYAQEQQVLRQASDHLQQVQLIQQHHQQQQQQQSQLNQIQIQSHHNHLHLQQSAPQADCRLQLKQECQVDLNSTSSESHSRPFYDTYHGGDSTESDFEDDNMFEDPASALTQTDSNFNGRADNCGKWME